MNSKNNIISVISNKGGVGKTSIAIATGFYLSSRRNEPTLLLELDSSPGDFGALFDISSDKSLDIAVRFPQNFKNYSKKILENLYAIKGSASPVSFQKIEPEKINVLLNYISGVYRNIIVDTQSLIDGTIIGILKSSSKILLITEYSVESISRNLGLYISLIERYKIERDRICLIVNKKNLLDYLKIWKYSDFSEFPIDGFISFDRSFSKTFFITNSSRLFYTKLFRQLEKIIQGI